MCVPPIRVFGRKAYQFPVLQHLQLLSQAPPMLIMQINLVQIEPKLRPDLLPEGVVPSFNFLGL